MNCTSAEQHCAMKGSENSRSGPRGRVDRSVGWLSLFESGPTDRLVDSTRRRDSSSLLGSKGLSGLLFLRELSRTGDLSSVFAGFLLCDLTHPAQSLDLASHPIQRSLKL